jgi:hypothetical protein
VGAGGTPAGEEQAGEGVWVADKGWMCVPKGNAVTDAMLTLCRGACGCCGRPAAILPAGGIPLVCCSPRPDPCLCVHPF